MSSPSPASSSASSASAASASQMKAVLVKAPGAASELYIGDASIPEPKSGEVLLEVLYTSINRADILQRQGKYPPPPGASSILGLEAVGVLAGADADADRSDKQQQQQQQQLYMTLLAGGGYAQFINVDERCLLPVPRNLSARDAAAIPEVWLTAYLLAHQLAHIKQGQVVLIHAGASGVGTALIQLAKDVGAIPIVTVSSAEKVDYCEKLGAVKAINYKSGSWLSLLQAYLSTTSYTGVDIVFDCVGASYFQDNLTICNMDAYYIFYGTLGGVEVEKFNMGVLLRKRIQFIGSTLRNRSLDFKRQLIQSFIKDILPKFESGVFQPIIDKEFSFHEIAQAHEYVESNQSIGKVILKVKQ